MTPNFSILELIKTETGLNNNPQSELEGGRLIQLAMNLEHVRDILSAPIYITSAFRSAAVNTKVKGKINSHHRLGYAADFWSTFGEPFDIVKILNNSWLPFDQLINEQEKGIVHISFAPGMRRQVLTQFGANDFIPGNYKRKSSDD